MQFIGTKVGLGREFGTEEYAVTFYTKDKNVIKQFEQLIGKDKIDVQAKEYKEQRSKDANAYFHVLINKLARYFNLKDSEMKIKMNLQYGTIAKDSNGNSIGVKIPKGTDITQFYEYAKWFGECEENGIKFDKYLFYKQTHTLDTKEMSQLINGVVQECQDVGIETKSKAEIDSLLKEWDKK